MYPTHLDSVLELTLHDRTRNLYAKNQLKYVWNGCVLDVVSVPLKFSEKSWHLCFLASLLSGLMSN